MSKSLIALALIAAATFAADQPEIQAGTAFTAADDAADKLIADGLAKPADAANATQNKGGKPVRVRLLVANEHGQPNDVRDLPPDVAKALVKSGDADDEKAAVAYAATLPQNQNQKKT